MLAATPTMWALELQVLEEAMTSVPPNVKLEGPLVGGADEGPRSAASRRSPRSEGWATKKTAHGDAQPKAAERNSASESQRMSRDW